MVRFRDSFHSLQAFFLVLVLVFVRIVPRLPLSGAKYRVEQGAHDIHARRNHKHDPPFRLTRLKRKRRDFIGYPRFRFRPFLAAVRLRIRQTR